MGEPVELPRRWAWLIRGFRKYCVRYVRTHFHAVRLSRSSHPFPPASDPVLIVVNHPAWWDPIIGLVLSNRFADRDQFAAIDAVAIERYGFFKRLGFVGVDTHSLRGAAEFLRVGQAILSQPNRVFWVTAQGRFADVRERPLALRSGVGHLAARLDGGVIVPLAVEYAFWNERTPEALARFGEPLRIADHPHLTGKQWTRLIEERLTGTLDALNVETITRDPDRFEELVGGRTGVGGLYDLWRRLKSLIRREKFDPSHSSGDSPGAAVSWQLLAWLAFAAAAFPAVLCVWNFFLFRAPPRHDPRQPRPAISVLIPARNEEASIAACVESVLASTDVELEVIVLDDHSDDRTAEIVRHLTAHDPRVRLESAPELPPGWCGKQHACAVLSKHARLPLLTFLDADVRLRPNALARMAAFLHTSRANLVSGFPRQETGTMVEHLLIPLINWLLVGYLPMIAMRLTRHPGFGVGCGQWFMTTREAYDSVGGHATVAASRHDGLMLPRAYRRAGFHTDICDATSIATCRMYRSASGVWNGLSKNAREGMAATTQIPLWTYLLFVGQVLPFVLVIAMPTNALVLSTVVLAFLPRVLSTIRFRSSWLGTILHPVGVVLLLAIQWYAVIRAAIGKPVDWKGRPQPITPAVIQ